MGRCDRGFVRHLVLFLGPVPALGGSSVRCYDAPVSDFITAKIVWVGILGLAAFIAGLMGWLPHQRGRRDDDDPDAR
jgi:hypothetical protein